MIDPSPDMLSTVTNSTTKERNTLITSHEQEDESGQFDAREKGSISNPNVQNAKCKLQIILKAQAKR